MINTLLFMWFPPLPPPLSQELITYHFNNTCGRLQGTAESNERNGTT